MVNYEEQVKELEKQLVIKDIIITKQAEQIKLLEQHVLHLDNKLRKYINENTPSSKKPEWDKHKSPDRINKEPKPIGKPKDSNGGTRATPDISDEVLVTLDTHEKYLGEPINFIERIVGDIPAPSKIKWVKFILAQYIDPATGNTITATHPECPKEGSFGPNLRALITLLREKARLSETQTIELLNSLYGVDISLAPGTLEAELNRAGKILSPHYNAIREAIDNAPVKHSDETGQSMNGKNWCVYGFSTLHYTYFFANEKKRAEHIKSRLNMDYNKILVCDGHSIYEWCPIKQRCWSHPIRKEAWLLDEKQTNERKFLHEAISGTFALSKQLLVKKPPGAGQIWNVLSLKNRLLKAIQYKWEDEKCKKVANYMKNGWDSWFTFMLVPNVEPTNNLNERDIRKHVMKRKITGAFRSEKSLDTHCILLSVIETWRKNNKNVYDELRNAITQHNSAISW